MRIIPFSKVKLANSDLTHNKFTDIFPFYVPSRLVYNGNNYSPLQALQLGVKKRCRLRVREHHRPSTSCITWWLMIFYCIFLASIMFTDNILRKTCMFINPQLAIKKIGLGGTCCFHWSLQQQKRSGHKSIQILLTVLV